MLLLDSSVLVWLLLNVPRIGRGARRRITVAPAVHVSSVSIAELTIKAVSGKLSIPNDLAQAVRDQGLVDLALTAEHAAAMRDFPELARHDPFDRLLVAQAAVTGMELLTSDRVLLDLGRDFIVDATQ